MARGTNIEKGDELHSYVGEDEHKRPIMINKMSNQMPKTVLNNINNKPITITEV